MWEKLSFKAENLKGQQYFLNPDFTLSVVNYAEIWGRQVAIRAQATFSPAATEAEKRKLPRPRVTSIEETTNTFLENILPNRNGNAVSAAAQRSIMVKNNDPSPESALRTCPDTYQLQTYSAEFQVGDTIVPLPIEGKASLVVLYADPRIRILSSPNGSNSALGKWEESGLVAVQIRSDLVTSDSRPLDLR